MTNHIGYLLADNSRMARWTFDRRTQAIGVTGPQARLLLLLDREPGEPQTHYAERLEVEPITLCRMVDRLEEAALVERNPCEQDRRARRLDLTEAGRAKLGALQTQVDAMVDDMLDGITATERAELARLLGRIGENLSAQKEQAKANHG